MSNPECYEYCPVARECALAKNVGVRNRFNLIMFTEEASILADRFQDYEMEKAFAILSGEITIDEIEAWEQKIGLESPNVDLDRYREEYASLDTGMTALDGLASTLEEAAPDCTGPRPKWRDRFSFFVGDKKQARTNSQIYGLLLSHSEEERAEQEAQANESYRQGVRIQLRRQGECGSKAVRTAFKEALKDPYLKEVLKPNK